MTATQNGSKTNKKKKGFEHNGLIFDGLIEILRKFLRIITAINPIMQGKITTGNHLPISYV